MSSVRGLKKDIRVITEQVIMDALELGYSLKKEEDKKQVLDIIIELSEKHNDLLSRVNHPDGKENSKLVREHFKSIIDDLLAACNKAYEKLGKLAA